MYQSAYRKDAYVLNFMFFVHVLIDVTKPLKNIILKEMKEPQRLQALETFLEKTYPNFHPSPIFRDEPLFAFGHSGS